MTQNRAREVRSPEGSWPPCTQSLAHSASRAGPLPCSQTHRSGGCRAPLLPSLSVPGQLFYQTWCSPASQHQLQQDPHVAPCPSTALISRPPGLNCWGPKVPTHPGLFPARAGAVFPVTGLGFSQSGPPPWQTTLAVPSTEGPLPSPQRLLSPSIPISPLLSSSCLPTLDLPSCLCVPAFLPLPPAPLCAARGRLQMENICSLELCNSPSYYFFL